MSFPTGPALSGLHLSGARAPAEAFRKRENSKQERLRFPSGAVSNSRNGAGHIGPRLLRGLSNAEMGGAEPSGRLELLPPGSGKTEAGRDLAQERARRWQAPPPAGGQARQGGFLLQRASPCGGAGREEGPSAESPAYLAAAASRGLPATRLRGQTGSGSSQWPARAEAGGGGSVCAAGLLSRGVGARAPSLLLH